MAVSFSKASQTKFFSDVFGAGYVLANIDPLINAGVVLQSATSVGSGAGVFRGMHQSGTVTLTLTADTTSTTGTTTGTTTTGTTGTNGIPIVTTPTTGTSTTTGTNGLIGNQGTGNPILPGVTQ